MLIECSRMYCNDEGHHPGCPEYLRQSYRIKYNERRALTLIIVLFFIVIVVILGGVFMLGASV